MPAWIDSTQRQPVRLDEERPLTKSVSGKGSRQLEEAATDPAFGTSSRQRPQNQAQPKLPAASLTDGRTAPPPDGRPIQAKALRDITSPLRDPDWPIPSALRFDPDQARAGIELPEFDASLLEKARIISDHFPAAEAEYRNSRGTVPNVPQRGLPHFENVFRISATLAGVKNAHEASDYDRLLILTAWHAVRPGTEGFLGSYPKALLCPLSHSAPPAALASLSPRQQDIFERRAPAYLRYLLCAKFGLRTCADIENADLRHLLRTTGFRLIRPSAVPEVAFPDVPR